MQMCYKNSIWEFDMDGSEKRRQILLRLMAEREINNQQLAEASGLHEVSISRYRSGESLLNDVTTLEKLARGLRVNICIFFDERYSGDIAIESMRRDLEELKKMLKEYPPGGATVASNFLPAAVRPKKKSE